MTDETRDQEDDVLDLWGNFDATTKVASITTIVSYVLTLLVAVMWGDYLSPDLNAVLVFWPFMAIIWIGTTWLLMAGALSIFVTTKSAIFGKTEDKHDTISEKLKKFIVFAPVVIGTLLSVVKVFVDDIFGD